MEITQYHILGLGCFAFWVFVSLHATLSQHDMVDTTHWSLRLMRFVCDAHTSPRTACGYFGTMLAVPMVGLWNSLLFVGGCFAILATYTIAPCVRLTIDFVLRPIFSVEYATGVSTKKYWRELTSLGVRTTTYHKVPYQQYWIALLVFAAVAILAWLVHISLGCATGDRCDNLSFAHAASVIFLLFFASVIFILAAVWGLAQKAKFKNMKDLLSGKFCRTLVYPTAGPKNS